MREADRSHCRSRCAPSTSSGWPAILRTTPESQVRTRLPAGGNRIRTIGPAVEETPFPTPDVSFRANGSDLRHSLRGTEGSNPVPSSGESDELRIRPPPNINKASSNRSRRRGYGAAGSGPRP